MAKQSGTSSGKASTPPHGNVSNPDEWPAAKVESRDLKQLVPYARNARTHTDEQILKIAASIEEWGWTNPVLISDDNTIIAGHGRVLAVDRLGIEAVPVVVARGWTDAQRRAYVIADNKLALEAGWDREVLAFEFAELEALDFDLTLTGFDQDGDVRDGVTRVDVPKAIKFAWALIGVPISEMGRLSMMVEDAQSIDGAIVEVCDDTKP